MRACLAAITVASVLMLGCGDHVPPNLTPQATAAWYGTQAIHDLDILRDTAIDANDHGILSEATTRKVVAYHESAIILVHSAPDGWKAAVSTGLDELAKDLPSADKKTIGPYISLAKAAIAEVK